MGEPVIMDISQEFILPIGLTKNGTLYREGTIRLPRNKDLLEIGDDPDLKKYAETNIEINGPTINIAKLIKIAAVKAASSRAYLPRLVKFKKLDEFTKADVESMYPEDTNYLMEVINKLSEDSGEKHGESTAPLT